MNCPFCSHDGTKVVDSRLHNEGDGIRRRRQCLSCSGRFTTHEVADLIMPMIKKSSGAQQAFDDHKLRTGLIRALEKRPIDKSRLSAAIMRIKKNILQKGEATISSNELGGLVMRELRQIDQVAYIRFASVYQRFDDISEFVDAIKEMR